LEKPSRALFFGLMASARSSASRCPDLSPDDDLKLADALAMIRIYSGRCGRHSRLKG